MLNLIKNPNLTSSHLFRADVLYDSLNDVTASPSLDTEHFSDFTKHMKTEFRPVKATLPGYSWQRAIVRLLIPRNTQVDKPLAQTCHFFSKEDGDLLSSVVLYIPHVKSSSDMPFYHPTVSKLAFLHTSPINSVVSSAATEVGSVSISYALFPSDPLSSKLERTALRLLQTIHKHGQGQQAGYQKRVHHDQIIPQRTFQDTYARLKSKYARHLSERWVEVTDPSKHVFEDLGIAAFLIELWDVMYNIEPSGAVFSNQGIVHADNSKPTFPGFVDIGCGNGVLVYILLQEGYRGWGFDARNRKTWEIFPSSVRERLKQRVLVPHILQTASTDSSQDGIFHGGYFERGTFIVSNHADELTPWTPLLAYLNDSPFIAIPCCSHNLAGARFRAPPSTKSSAGIRAAGEKRKEAVDSPAPHKSVKSHLAAETGSLARTPAQKKMPSAYSTLCSYVSALAEEVGFEAEKEMLRIPSTRNTCIVGRQRRSRASAEDLDPIEEHASSKQPSSEADGVCQGTDAAPRREEVVDLVTRELGMPIEQIASEWIERAKRLTLNTSAGH